MLCSLLWATMTTCLIKGCGAIIVRDKRIIATGFNGAVPGAPHCRGDGRKDCRRREMGFGPGEGYEHSRASHAEKNAIANAANAGVSIKGATMHTAWYPCADCMKLIGVAGIRLVVYMLPSVDKHAPIIAEEAGIRCLKLRLGCASCVHYTLLTSLSKGEPKHCRYNPLATEEFIPEVQSNLIPKHEWRPNRFFREGCPYHEFNGKTELGWIIRTAGEIQGYVF